MEQQQHECVGEDVEEGTLFRCTQCSRQVMITNGVFKVINRGEDPSIPHTGFTFVGDEKSSPMKIKVERKSDSNQKTT
jgi:hypothetical protein